MSQATPPFPSGPMPLTIGQTLDRIFRLLRRHFVLFLRVAGVLAAALLVIYGLLFGALFLLGLFSGPGRPPVPIRIFAVLFPAIFVAGFAFMLVYAIFEAAETHAALQANLGIEVTFREAYRIGFRNAGRFTWLMILRNLWVGLPVFAIYGLIAGIVYALFRNGSPAPGAIFVVFPLVFLAYFGTLAYAVVMMLRLALAVPACLAESVTARAALKRSVALTRNAKGRIFVVLLVVYAAGYAAMMIVQFVCMAVVMCGVLLSSTRHLRFTDPLAAVGIGVVVLCLFAALFFAIAALAASYVIAFAVLYHDQRLRIDGVAPEAPAGEPA